MTSTKPLPKPVYMRERPPATSWIEQQGIQPEARPYTWDELWFTQHSRNMMRARDITPQQVFDIMLDPEIIENQEGRLRFVRRGLVVVLGSKKHRHNNWPIVTVLLRERKQWTDKDVRER